MAQKTKEQLTSDANSQLPNNTSAAINAAKVRQRILDLIDSCLSKSDESSTLGRQLLNAVTEAAARTILELGNSATLDVGTTAGTVAAGDHTHGGSATWICEEDSSQHTLEVRKLANGDYIVVPVLIP